MEKVEMVAGLAMVELETVAAGPETVDQCMVVVRTVVEGG